LSIFIFIIVVGIVTTAISKHGFIAAIDGAKDATRQASYILIIASLIALLVAYLFQGNITYSAVLPIIALALLQRYLLSRCNNISNKQGEHSLV